MRITFILPGYPWRPVGGFRVVYEYANRLVGRGHAVAVVHPRRMPRHIPSPPHGILPHMRERVRRARNLFLTPRVRWNPIDRRIRMLYIPEPTAKHIPDGDAVFATAWQTAEYVMDCPQEKGAKFYLIQSYEVWGGPRERVDATWRAPVKKVVIAQWLYDKGIELGVLASGMIHIPNGIDHTRYRVLRPIDNRPLRVAMMHSRLGVKGGQDGLQALGSAKAGVPHLEALVFGTDARPRGLPGWIRYFRDPHQSDLIRSIYNESSIYLCPSLTEGWALPPAEAMACGCALVSTDIGGVRDYAEHEATALLSTAGNPQALADSMVRMVSNDDLRVRLAKAGHARIQEFTWEKSTDLLEGFLSAD